MTHFSVLVVVPADKKDGLTDYINRTMMQFDETIDVEPYVAITPESVRKEMTQRIVELERIIATNNTEVYDIEKAKTRLSQLKATDPAEEYKKQCELYDQKNEKGEPLTTRNPLAKIDCFSMDGWEGFYVYGSWQSHADFGKVDFDLMESRKLRDAKERLEDLKKAGKPWRICDFPSTTVYETEEDFIVQHSKFCTCAVVTKDGIWHEPAEVGWWGMTRNRSESETEWAKHFKERFLDGLDKNDHMVILDCHI